jgi:hypothetical protein
MVLIRMSVLDTCLTVQYQSIVFEEVVCVDNEFAKWIPLSPIRVVSCSKGLSLMAVSWLLFRLLV